MDRSASSSDPCPVEGLISEVSKLTGEGGVMTRLVNAVKSSNDLALGNNLHLKWVSSGLIVCLLILVGLTLSLWRTTLHLEENLLLTANAVDKLDRTDRKVDDVKEQQKEAKEEAAEKPKVELVPETDPERAKVAPIKVRITAPALSVKHPPLSLEKAVRLTPPPATPPVVELPLPVNSSPAK